MTGYAIAPVARDEMRDIIDYIAQDNPAAANSVLDTIFDAFDDLAAHPAMGHTRDDLMSQKVRFWTVLGRYSVVYREYALGVEIVRVLGPGRDIESILR